MLGSLFLFRIFRRPLFRKKIISLVVGWFVCYMLYKKIKSSPVSFIYKRFYFFFFSSFSICWLPKKFSIKILYKSQSFSSLYNIYLYSILLEISLFFLFFSAIASLTRKIKETIY